VARLGFGQTQGGASLVVNFASVVPALNTFASAPSAAIAQVSDGVICSAIGGTNGAHFGVKYENPTGTWDLSDLFLAIDLDWMSSEAVGGAGTGSRFVYPEIQLVNDAGTAYTNWARFANLGSGFSKLPGPMTLMTNPANIITGAGTFNPRAVKRIEIRFNTQTGSPTALHRVKVQRVWQRARSRPVVAIGFDDQYSSIYTTAWPLMQARGMVGTMYVQPQAVGASGRMTWAQLQELANAGWTIGSHPMNHDNYTLPLNLTWSAGVVTATVASVGLNHGFNTGQVVQIRHAYEPEYNGTFPITVTGLNTFTYAQALAPVNTTANGYPRVDWWTEAQIRANFLDVVAAMNRNLTGPNIRPDVFAYTNGAFSDFVVNVLSGLGIKIGRTTETGSYMSAGGMIYSTGNWRNNRLRLPAFTMQNGTTSAAILQTLTNGPAPFGGIPFGCACEIYGHQIDNGDITLAEFTAFLDGVRTLRNLGLCDVVNKARFADALL
jgi:peptidoglycan/xylan/chitin deacetylase (PgdA/CDA1 family)